MDVRKMRLEKRISILMLSIIALVIFGFFIFNLPVVYNFIIENKNQDKDIYSIRNDFEDAYNNGFYIKNSFVNLNGLFAKLLGKKVLNDVIKLNNGYLSNVNEKRDINRYADNIKTLKEYLATQNSNLLYVQLPSKSGMYDVKVPDGIEDYTYENKENLLILLNKYGVDSIDIMELMKEEGLTTEEVFYKTDHHWRNEAALWTSEKILGYMSEKYGIIYDKNLCDIDNFNIDIYKDWFLGSWGKRVGTLYGGVDDISMLYPSFDTSLITIIAKNGVIRSGNFYDSIFDLGRIKEKDYFNNTPYSVYIGGDYALVAHYNEKAQSDQKVLILKDSYTLPLQAFMSLHFKNIEVIDLRHYNSSSLYEYLEQSKPDIVMLCYNADLSDQNLFFFGDSNIKADPEDPYVENTIFNTDHLTIGSEDERFNYYRICDDLQPGKHYSLNIGNIKILEGKTERITVRLYDFVNKKVVMSTEFDVNSEETQTWLFTVPNRSNGISLVAYAGQAGETSGISVELYDVSINTTTKGKQDLNLLKDNKNIDTDSIIIEANNTNSNYCRLYDYLQPGVTYNLSIDLINGNTDSITIRTYDFEDKEVVNSIELEIGNRRNITWSFTIPDDESVLSLLIYAGIAGETAGNSMVINNMSLRYVETNNLLANSNFNSAYITIEASESKYNYNRIHDGLLSGKTYKLTMDDIINETGDIYFVKATLYDFEQKKDINSMYFGLSWEGPYTWTFTVPSETDNLSLIIYAGLAGNTAGNSLSIANAKLEKIS